MKSLKDGQYEYRESDFLGEGSFAKVYRGVIVKTQRVIAVRLLSLKLIKQFGNKIKSIISTPYPNCRPGSQRLEGALLDSRARLSVHHQNIRLLPHRAQHRHDSLILPRRQLGGCRLQERAHSRALGYGDLISAGERTAVYLSQESCA